jgi:FAD/FMN-containing dehydrogenase
VPADIHGHLREEIMEDVAAGTGDLTGLEILPTIVGLAPAGPVPPEAQGRPQPLLWAEKNWSGFVNWSHSHGLKMAQPSTLEEVQEIVRHASKVRVLGRGHGFPAICDQSDADGVLMSLLPNMGAVLEIDPATRTVTVEGGCVYHELVKQLEGSGLALQNTQSLGHITVAGGVATGSHGSSGVDPATERARLPSTASLVSGLQIVTADGSAVEYTRAGNPEIWGGVVTSLGCQGVVTRLTLDLVEDFDVHSYGYGRIPADHFLSHWREMLRDPDCTSFNAMVQWPCTEVSCGYQHFIPAGSLATAPAVPDDFFGAGVGSDSRGNNVVRWHQSVLGMSPKGIPEEFQLEFFIPLEFAEDALRVTWCVCLSVLLCEIN